jgi:hypothetical protein
MYQNSSTVLLFSLASNPSSTAPICAAPRQSPLLPLLAPGKKKIQSKETHGKRKPCPECQFDIITDFSAGDVDMPRSWHSHRRTHYRRDK